MQKIAQITNRIETILECLISALFSLMIIVVMIQVVVRYIPSMTVSWTEELTRFIFVWAICIGSGAAMISEDFVSVDLITGILPKRVRAAFIGTFYLAIAIFSFISLYYSFGFAAVGINSLSATLKGPMVVQYSSIIVSYCFCGIFAALNSFKYYYLQMIKGYSGNEDSMKGWNV